jgi:hypothetical protein
MSNTLWPAPVQRIVLGWKFPHKLDAFTWKVTGRRKEDIDILNPLQTEFLLINV